jgi:hypothetical protein
MKTNSFLFMFALSAFLLVSCGDDDPLDAAWAKFEDQAYVEAHAAFAKLVSSEGSAALVGLGWTTLRMDSMAAADRYFDQAKADSIVDGYAGWSCILWVQERYAESLAKATFALRKQPNYKFPYDHSVTDEDLRLHQAYGYFHLGEYNNCILKIRTFDQEANFPLTSTPQEILLKLEELKRYAL